MSTVVNEIAYRLEGPPGAPVVVMAGSLGTTMEAWDPQVETIARDLRVLRFDLPGCGETPLWDGPVTVEGIGGAVIALLDSLGLERVSFCGTSLGGMVGQWLAAHAAERIDRLVLCCTAAYLGPPEMWFERAVIARQRGMSVIAEQAPARWFTPRFHEIHPSVVNHLLQTLEHMSREGYAECCEAVARFDGRTLLHRIKAPTLVIAGWEDAVVPVAHAQALAEAIRGAHLILVDRAGHLANVERPDVVTGLIRDHLEHIERGMRAW